MGKDISKAKYLKALRIIDDYKNQQFYQRQNSSIRNKEILKTLVKGDKVKCIRTIKINSKHLTLGKEYEVLKIQSSKYSTRLWFCIRTDDSKLRHYNKLFTFEKVETI